MGEEINNAAAERRREPPAIGGAGARYGIEPGPPAHDHKRPAPSGGRGPAWEPARALLYMAEPMAVLQGNQVLFANPALCRVLGLAQEDAQALAWPEDLLDSPPRSPAPDQEEPLFLAAGLKQTGRAPLPVTVRLHPAGPNGVTFAFFSPLPPLKGQKPAQREQASPEKHDLPQPSVLLAKVFSIGRKAKASLPGPLKGASPSRELRDLADALFMDLSPLLAQPRLEREELAACLVACGKSLREYYGLAEDDFRVEALVGLSSLPASTAVFLLVAVLEILNQALVRNLERPGKETALLRLFADERGRTVLRVFGEKNLLSQKLKSRKSPFDSLCFLTAALAARQGALLILKGRATEHRLILPREGKG